MDILAVITIGVMFILFAGFELNQHRKTRKDIQEVKTSQRASQKRERKLLKK